MAATATSSTTPSSTTLDPTNTRDWHDAASTASTQRAHHLEQAQPYWGYGPLAHIASNTSTRLPAFGGTFQPGLYKPPTSAYGNPAPLGLSGFALTTFLLSLINLSTRGISGPNLVVAPALAYGGLIQLLAGMWEMALGNTFGATALSSYGGFWISVGIIFTPGGFEIAQSYGGETGMFYDALGLYLVAWFIFTFLLWLLTLRSTVAFSSLFFCVWLSFLMLGVGYMDHSGSSTSTAAAPNQTLIKAGGGFGIVAAFIAWWNMLAGIADTSNSFFLVPVLHFPWSAKGREDRKKRRESVAGSVKGE